MAFEEAVEAENAEPRANPLGDDYVPDSGWRVCEACRTPKPLNHKNFRKAPDGKKGHDYVCVPCRKALKAKQKLERMETNACMAFVAKASSGGSHVPHTSELLESVMDLFGGSNGFATQLVRQYYAAPAGGRIRTSILDMVVKLTGKVAESGATRAPVALLTDEELEKELNERINSAVITYKGQQVLGVEKAEEQNEPVEVEDRRLA
jgi:hypothetical protein